MISKLEAAEYFNGKVVDWITSGIDTQYCIEQKEDGEVIIAFLGSNSPVDWKTNFTFWKKPYKDMEVTYYCHGGFLKCWKAIRDEIEEKVKSLNPTSITVTGHSYGGAISTFCLEDMWYCFPELRDGKLQGITFGAPRVIGFWNYKKIKERWESMTLFANGSDIVTCVPFCFLGFRHVKKVFHIGDLRRPLDFFKAEKYHAISAYERSLKTCM